jgi:hypothetical protein
VPQNIVHRAARSRVELEITAFGIADQDALALECAADALRQPLHQRL